MSHGELAVFFYGLFMDQGLLKSKGIRPRHPTVACLDGYSLRIGRRATLLPEPDGRAYGVLMNIRPADAAALYAEESVADYVPEKVVVTLPGGVDVSAVCYNLPPDKILKGSNPQYAQALLALATRIGFPEDYLRQIASQGERARRSQACRRRIPTGGKPRSR